MFLDFKDKEIMSGSPGQKLSKNTHQEKSFQTSLRQKSTLEHSWAMTTMLSEEEKCEPIILYPGKLLFKWEDERQIF